MSPTKPSNLHGPAEARRSRKSRIGVVVSNKMQKTIVVRIDRLVEHPFYRRVIKRSNTFKAHDEDNTAKIGDTVRIAETRPISKDKRWRLVEIVRRGGLVEQIPAETQAIEQVVPKP